MDQQLGNNLKKSSSKVAVSGQQTRRSMISRQQNPASIHQPNIEDILALQLSDNLINAAYILAVTSITVGIRKLCDPLEKGFLLTKSQAFENLRIYANRSGIKLANKFENDKMLESKSQIFYNKQSLLTQIDLLRDSKIEYEQNKNELIILTKEQQKQKVLQHVKSQISKIFKMLTNKRWRLKCTGFYKIQGYEKAKQSPKKSSKNEIQQTFERYEESRLKGRHFHRRSIDKHPTRKSHNQLTYSLNKNHDLQRVQSPQKASKGSKNLIYPYTKTSTDQKASTCSQTQSNNSNSQSLNREYYTTGLKARITPTVNISRSKPQYFSSNQGSSIEESKASSQLKNGSYFAQGTKQRELQLLRNKYYKLVEEFKDFSERFLQVIKEE